MEQLDIVKLFLQFNFNINPDALEFIQKNIITESELKSLIQKISSNEPIINLEIIKQAIDKTEPDKKHQLKSLITTQDQNNQFIKEEKVQVQVKSPGKEKKKVQIIIDQEIPYKLNQEPRIPAFQQLFNDRYQQLSKILLENIPAETLLLKSNLQREEVPIDRTGLLVGMIRDTQVLHTNRFVIQLEDQKTSQTTKCVIVEDSKTFPEYRNIVRDTVIGVSGVLPKNYQEGRLTAFWGKDIILPSFKEHKTTFSEVSTKVLCLSDIHFGSQTFSRNLFTRLIAYLKEEIDTSSFPIPANEIDTIIIAGDLVEGTGLYMKNQDNLPMKSYETQYQQLTELLKEIPPRMKILTIPGEHDAAQLAIPQPAIDKKVGKSLYSIPNIQNHGNPLRLTINGMKFLVYHAQSCEKIFHNLMKIDLHNPIKGFKNLLEYRHLSPEYGSYVTFAPYNKDYLVINEIPDVLLIGHFHQTWYEMYKGVRIVTSGTFERPSKKEPRSRVQPSVGVFPIIDTGTGEITLLDLKTFRD